MIWCIYSSKHFFYYQDIFKTSSGSIQDIFSGTIFCPAKRFEDILKTSWNVLQIRLADNLKTPWGHLPRRLEDVLKTSSLKKFWRRLGRGKIVTLKICWRRFQGMSWRRLQDVLKTNKCLLGSLSSRFVTKFVLRYLHFENSHVSQFSKKLFIVVKTAG